MPQSRPTYLKVLIWVFREQLCCHRRSFSPLLLGIRHRISSIIFPFWSIPSLSRVFSALRLLLSFPPPLPLPCAFSRLTDDHPPPSLPLCPCHTAFSLCNSSCSCCRVLPYCVTICSLSSRSLLAVRNPLFFFALLPSFLTSFLPFLFLEVVHACSLISCV